MDRGHLPAVRMWLVAALVLVVSALGSGTALGLSPARVTPSIVGGHPVPTGSEPAVVALGTRGDPAADGAFCGGTLIHPSWVVTAAHCAQGFTAADVTVVVGRTELTSREGTEVPAARIVRYGWNPRTERNDIALVKLLHAVSQPPMPVATSADLAYGARTPAVIAGWGGTTRYGSWPADHLQEGDVRMVAHWRCQELWGGISRRTQVCAGLTTATTVVDSCVGDSGGPLMVTDSSGIRRLAGITSFGGRRCATPYDPAVYTRVAPYLPWIARVIRSY